jgi:hypothetical protein
MLRVMVTVLLLSTLSPSQPDSGAVTVVAPSAPPQLFFACCDGGIKDAKAEFTSPALISDLQSLHAGIAISISDLSPERAEIVQTLNHANIPVIAWLVLAPEQGLYLNADNEPAAAARFAEFERWTATYQLKWIKIGLDIEPNFQQFGEWNRGHKLRVLSTLARNYCDFGRVRRARESYASLIAHMRERGYVVQTHQLMFLADERLANTTVLERLFGIVNVASDDEVLMIYSSFNHVADGALAYSYGPDAHSIAVGSTAASGDPLADAKYPPLSLTETLRDLRVASRFSREVGVYNLEGFLRQGMMPELKTMQWDEPVAISQASLKKAQQIRHGVKAILWLATYAPLLLAAFCLALYGLVRSWRRRRHRRLSELNAGSVY